MIANALPRPLTAGSVDNAILRADGTGGTILQNSGLIVDDAVVAYSVTGDAATDVITATGHNFIANQGVMFPSLTGGGGLNTTTVYFVRDISGSTFKVSATSGGAAVNITTNYTAGSVIAIQSNLAISQNTTETNSSLVLTPKGVGALIAGPKPDGTTTGGNSRGGNAIDLQRSRASASNVAAGSNSILGGGSSNQIGGSASNSGILCGDTNTIQTSGANSAIVTGFSNSITNQRSFIGGGWSNSTTGGETVVVGGRSNAVNSNYSAILGGYRNSATGNNSVVCGGGSESPNIPGNSASGQISSVLCGSAAVADRWGMQSHASGQFNTGTSAVGDAQRARFVMRNKTTTNSAVELFLDGSSTRLTIPSGKIFAFTINIAGVSSTGGAVAHYMRQYCVKNVAGTTSEVYAPITIGTDNAAGTSIALSASDAADALVVSVTGTASTIWRWVASVDAVEIAYGT